MSTNYFFRTNYCKHCKRFDTIHIGHLSYGHKFLFHQQKGLENLNDFLTLKKKYTIIDEYDRVVPKKKFIEILENSKKGKHQKIFILSEGFDWCEDDFR